MVRKKNQNLSRESLFKRSPPRSKHTHRRILDSEPVAFEDSKSSEVQSTMNKVVLLLLGVGD